MNREITFKTQLQVPVVLASMTLEGEGKSLVFDGARVRRGQQAIKGGAARWDIAVEPMDARGQLPTFKGELQATSSPAGTELTLVGRYRLPVGDVSSRIRAHMDACDSLRGIFEHLVDAVDAECDAVLAPVGVAAGL